MSKFTIHVRATVYRTYQVEAESLEQALKTFSLSEPTTEEEEDAKIVEACEDFA